MKLLNILIVGIALLLTCSIGTVGSGASPESKPCKVGRSAPAFRKLMWSNDATVRVFTLDGHFDAQEISIIRTTLQEWTAVSNSPELQVNFFYAGQTQMPQSCRNCLTVLRGHTSGPDHAALLDAQTFVPHGAIKYAKLVIGSQIRDQRELANVLAHEIGHSFGLLDCYTCGDRSTIMNAVNSSKGRSAPSDCDMHQIKNAYRDNRQQLAALRKQSQQTIDEGEEPIEDDTPIVIGQP